ncbi:uncharacterized protein LOC135931471 [Gordionus sp. m RMFG-2023]|uniref:uncharacterized protein LOC135931471 n=1 Tax=Gordionus sp. m RMFG-2023 TaxID=3053472 RepID=UPI0031FC11F1
MVQLSPILSITNLANEYKNTASNIINDTTTLNMNSSQTSKAIDSGNSCNIPKSSNVLVSLINHKNPKIKILNDVPITTNNHEFLILDAPSYALYHRKLVLALVHNDSSVKINTSFAANKCPSCGINFSFPENLANHLQAKTDCIYLTLKSDKTPIKNTNKATEFMFENHCSLILFLKSHCCIEKGEIWFTLINHVRIRKSNHWRNWDTVGYNTDSTKEQTWDSLWQSSKEHTESMIKNNEMRSDLFKLSPHTFSILKDFLVEEDTCVNTGENLNEESDISDLSNLKLSAILPHEITVSDISISLNSSAILPSITVKDISSNLNPSFISPHKIITNDTSSNLILSSNLSRKINTIDISNSLNPSAISPHNINTNDISSNIGSSILLPHKIVTIDTPSSLNPISISPLKIVTDIEPDSSSTASISPIISPPLSEVDKHPFLCIYCTAPFKSASSLDSHSRLHYYKSPISCPECSTGFTKLQDLHDHLIASLKDGKVSRSSGTIVCWVGFCRRLHYSCPFCQGDNNDLLDEDSSRGHIKSLHEHLVKFHGFLSGRAKGKKKSKESSCWYCHHTVSISSNDFWLYHTLNECEASRPFKRIVYRCPFCTKANRRFTSEKMSQLSRNLSKKELIQNIAVLGRSTLFKSPFELALHAKLMHGLYFEEKGVVNSKPHPLKSFPILGLECKSCRARFDDIGLLDCHIFAGRCHDNNKNNDVLNVINNTDVFNRQISHNFDLKTLSLSDIRVVLKALPIPETPCSQSPLDSLETTYDCDICGNRAVTKLESVLHALKHVDIMPHFCPVCPNTRMGSQKDFDEHLIKSHQGRIDCCHCSVHFNSLLPYIVHLQSINAEKIEAVAGPESEDFVEEVGWTCEICPNVGFTSLSSLRTHLLVAHKITHYPKSESGASNLDTLYYSNDDSNICAICSQSFSDTITLLKHGRIHGMAFIKSRTIMS